MTAERNNKPFLYRGTIERSDNWVKIWKESLSLVLLGRSTTGSLKLTKLLIIHLLDFYGQLLKRIIGMSMSREVRFVQFLGLGGFGRVSIIFVFELSLREGGSASICICILYLFLYFCICIWVCEKEGARIGVCYQSMLASSTRWLVHKQLVHKQPQP